MVFCIVGLIIFGILGLFSAKYRRYFRESLHCMRRQLLLKPCDTQFDNEMKAKISAGVSKVSTGMARFVFRKFVLLSWILLVLMIASVIMVMFGVYNYVAYGNCNGPFSSDFCVFGVLDGSFDEKVAKIKPISMDDDPTLGDFNASNVHIIEVGCFSCPYTKDAEQFRGQLLEKYGGNVSFTFRSMPLPQHELSFERAEAADCALEQGKYWEYHDLLFQNQANMTMDKLKELAAELELNTTQFDACLDSEKYRGEVQKDYDDAVAANIFATPTYFVNGVPLVGIKAFAQFENIVVSSIEGSCLQ